MIISIGSSRNCKTWKRTEMSFDALIEKTKRPFVSSETYKEYLNLSREKQDELKDIGGYVGGELKESRRTKKSVAVRTLVALDADNLGSKEDLDRVIEALNIVDYNYIIHATRKNTKEKPRIRILLPLKTAIAPEKYEPIVRGLCKKLGMGFFDPTTTEVNRLMFWPSVCADTLDDYIFVTKTDRDFLDGDKFLNAFYKDWQDVSEWPVWDVEDKSVKENALKQEDPLKKEGPIGIFCRSYSISEAIETFLPGIYRPEDSGRYTYIPGSTSNGAVCYDDKFLYSFHATDPISQKLCNAYDLVRIHLFGDTKKSNEKMLKLIAEDEKCQRLKAHEAAEEMPDIGKEVEDGLRETFAALTLTEKGEAAKTIENICIILRKDPNLKESFFYDAFAQKIFVTKKLPWNDGDDLPRDWTDFDDSGLRGYLERFYHIYDTKRTADAFNTIVKERSRHPVKEYFNSLEWDSVPRLETLLIDYFGAEDNAYSREAIKKALTAVVARVFNPGTKFDNMPILVGRQGVGKSTFLSVLGGDWFSDSLCEFEGAGAYEMLQNKLIVEIPELNGFYKREMNQIKQFLSKQVDEYRAPYARRKTSHPRECVIFGTTNDDTFLRDRTGNRRFWPIQLGVNEPTKSVWDDLPKERDQIWAECYVNFVLGDNLMLSPEAQKLAEIEQGRRLEDDSREGQIIEFLNREVPVDWNRYDYGSRMLYWGAPESYEGETVKRDRVCPAEIARELFLISKKDINKSSREINSILNNLPGISDSKRMRFGPEYGVQRGRKITPEFYDFCIHNWPKC